MYHTQFLNLCVQNTHVDEWQHGICESSHYTVYISSALKTTVPVVLEICRQEGGPVSQAGLWLCLSLRDGARLHPLPSSLPAPRHLGPGAVHSRLEAGLCALPLPLLLSSAPSVPLPSSLALFLPSPRETRHLQAMRPALPPTSLWVQPHGR